MNVLLVIDAGIAQGHGTLAVRVLEPHPHVQ
jgi:hypothetical protein